MTTSTHDRITPEYLVEDMPLPNETSLVLSIELAIGFRDSIE